VPTVEVDGAGLHVEERGSGSDLLLIHGSGGDASIWGQTRDRLAERHRVIAYDRRGYSRSVHAPVRDYRRHVADAAAVLEHFGARDATVVGWSSGGAVALGLVIRHAEMVGGLVVVEPLFHGLRHATPALLRALLEANALKLRGRRQDAATALYCFLAGYSSGGNSFDRMPPTMRQSLLANADSVLAEAGLVPHPHGAVGEDLSKRAVRGIPIPVAYVRGELSDPWFHRMHHALERALPSMTTTHAPGASHIVHYDAPEAFVDAVTNATANRTSTAR
jgi:pimeloyl-ACP methyl ester carboxylesterase